MDPALYDSSTRLQICDDIGSSGIFARYRKYPIRMVDMTDIYDELQRVPKYAHILHQLYAPRNSQDSQDPYAYTNPYTICRFTSTIFPSKINKKHIHLYKKEYVFMCLLKREDTHEIIPFYVSKAYDVHYELDVHRFVFTGLDSKYPDVMLAERSARAFTTMADFNVELHYLEMRTRYHSSME